MRTQNVWADTIDKAAEEILDALKEKTDTTRSVSSRDNVFYFDGWDGLGASAVLRAITQRLTATSPDGKRALAEMEFDQVMHIDCSLWESRRALQRVVAQKLELPDEVMKILDRQDEEDDFLGVGHGSRVEVQQVVREMQQHIQKMDRRFLVVFHNGSSEEIDLASCCGLPLSGFSTSKVLWTFQGRFRLKPRVKVDMALQSTGTSDVFISVAPDSREQEELWPYLVLQEAEEVIVDYSINAGPSGRLAEVAECFLYMLDLGCRGRHSIDYDLATHSSNYWVCDYIIQRRQHGGRDISDDHDDDSLWRAAEAMRFGMTLDVDYHQYRPPSSHFARSRVESKPHWTSPTYGCIIISTGTITDGDMFQHFNRLSVLKLSCCAFNFQSPPFLCCHNLRFLWLDRCQGIGTSTDRAGKEEDVSRCFKRLWVLDVRFTDCDQILSTQILDLMTQLRELNVMGAQFWDIGQLQGRLPNIRKLRVRKSMIRCSCSENDLFLEMNKMELLDFSENNTVRLIGDRRVINYMQSLSGPGAMNISSCLETVIFGQCCGIEHISLRGCAKLKNLLLRGEMWNLHTINISETPVKTLDLTTTEIHYLHELHLIDCEKLCAIMWPPKEKMNRDNFAKLCISTIAQSSKEKGKRGTATTTVLHDSRPTSEFSWHISVRDARLLQSLEAVYSDSRKIYVEVSSPKSPTIIAAGCCNDERIKRGRKSEQQMLVVNLHQQQPAPPIYADATVEHLQQTSEGDVVDAPGIMWMWPCPDVPDLPEKNCFMHIQDQSRTRDSEETSTITVPQFVLHNSKILHAHDSLSITLAPLATIAGSEWYSLEWCRIERCPKVQSIFALGPLTGADHFIYTMRTFWGSQLPKVRYIWNWSETYRNGYYRSFPYLTFLHLDCCPRLLHVLPVSHTMIAPSTLRQGDSLTQLETLEITFCGDIREIFPLDARAKRYVEEERQTVALDFPGLKYIHLLELPSLQRICGLRMYAPNLKTVKIRGCWSLKHLPDVGSDRVVDCDCEKEWWDRLEWDDSLQESRYKPVHSPYYKKTLLRSSVLR